MFANGVRIVLITLAVFLLGLGAVMLGSGRPGFVVPMIWGGLLLVGVAFERWRYKRIETSAGPGFDPTPERFVDPTSGERLRVWLNPATGERRYVRDPAD